MKNNPRTRFFASVVTLFACTFSVSPIFAADYSVDPAHSFIQFRIQHLGYSMLLGRFNMMSGSFSFDPEKPSALAVNVDVDPASVDTNHAERDKHLRSADTTDRKADRLPRKTEKAHGRA